MHFGIISTQNKINKQKKQNKKKLIFEKNGPAADAEHNILLESPNYWKVKVRFITMNFLCRFSKSALNFVPYCLLKRENRLLFGFYRLIFVSKIT